ncbi:hypothetical protein [Streptomyces sp. NPDC087859]|uniref:hypothetical protein n=1 Tax=Streptomyces sp. NPDC087859 TaxID=3365812 RepID=UPI003818058D
MRAGPAPDSSPASPSRLVRRGPGPPSVTLASTAFAPLTGRAVLAAHFGRRATYTALAAVLAADTVPAHALALCVPWPRRHRRGSGTTVRSRPFWSLRCAHQEQEPTVRRSTDINCPGAEPN